jgi:hypothetical protein
MPTGAIVAVIVVIVLASSIWVSHDSDHYDWDSWTHPTHPEWNCAAESPATWLVACLFLWPVFFPGYFWDRRYAPKKARTAPPDSSR